MIEDGEIREITPEVFKGFLRIIVPPGFSSRKISEALVNSQTLYLRLTSDFDLEIALEPFKGSLLSGTFTLMTLSNDGLNYKNAELASILRVAVTNSTVPDEYIAALLESIGEFINKKDLPKSN